MPLLENRIAVITGAGGGIGKAVAAQFAKEGAFVVCQDLNQEAATETLEIVKGEGSDGMVFACDVANRPAIDEMFEAVQKDHGVVTVLVNNAGVDKVAGDGSDETESAVKQMAIMSDESWLKMLDIHLNGAFYCTRAMLRALIDEKNEAKNQSASIVCISSIAGLSGWGPLHYATAKGGLLGFVRSIARMAGSVGIRANAVCPGVIDTGMTKAVPKHMIDGLQMITPMGRVGEADEVAQAVLYLASEQSSFVTGQAISPNGGLVI